MAGRQSGKIYRTTISIPLDLKERMDKAGEDVNWSAVAARAFEEKLAQIASKKKEKTMDDVIQRLKAAAAQEESEDYQEGMEAGRAWAMEDAKPKELRRIARYVAGNEAAGTPWWDVDWDGWEAPFGATDNFVIATWPEAEDDRSLLTTFWEEALGDAGRIEDPQFFRGFGEGVVGVWKQVRDKL